MKQQQLTIGDGYLWETKTTLEFPSYGELMNLKQGECVVSNPFSCGDNNEFCVKLYPRGGGHGSSASAYQETGFGMSYNVLPMFGKEDEKVGIYLQYLGDSSVDATFALRLKGKHSVGKRFDVEWRAGMRFVPLEDSDSSQGYANDFGAHLMQTPILKDFLGVYKDDVFDDTVAVTAEIEVTVHNTTSTTRKEDDTSSEKYSGGLSDIIRNLGSDIRNLRNTESGDHSELVRTGKVIVPVLRRLGQRPQMFEIGAYPGVDYRILRILKDGKERFTSCPGADYELKPIYPLVSQLERPWPITVNEKEIPKVYTQSMYNAVSAIGSFLTAAIGLAAAFTISQAVSLFFIPSRSMDPTLQVGDVLLVDKISPRLLHQQKAGDVVLFSPPSALRDIVAANGGKLTNRDLFVKRIAAQPGDKVEVDASGKVMVNSQPVAGRRDLCSAEPLRLIEKYVKAKEATLGEGDFFLMGDCSSVSVDSRVWGPLKESNIVGKPILRLWPLDRLGPVQTLPLLTTEDNWTY